MFQKGFHFHCVLSFESKRCHWKERQWSRKEDGRVIILCIVCHILPLPFFFPMQIKERGLLETEILLNSGEGTCVFLVLGSKLDRKFCNFVVKTCFFVELS